MYLRNRCISSLLPKSEIIFLIFFKRTVGLSCHYQLVFPGKLAESLEQDVKSFVVADKPEEQYVASAALQSKLCFRGLPLLLFSEMGIKWMLEDGESGVRLQFEQIFGDSFAQCNITVAFRRGNTGSAACQKIVFRAEQHCRAPI